MIQATTLENYLMSYEKSKFVWGKNDCCTFASNWVEEVSKVNPLKELGFYGKYKTAGKAVKILDKLGGLEKVLTKALGESIHTAYAVLGDVVMGDLDHGETMGICMGSSCIFLSEEGITTEPTYTMKKVWRI